MARKARKCQSQNGRLALPALELAYLFLAIAHAPKQVILEKMLPLVDVQLAELRAHAKDTKKYGLLPGSGSGSASEKTAGARGGKAGVGYWDDWCLTRFFGGDMYAICGVSGTLASHISFELELGFGFDMLWLLTRSLP